MGGIDFYYMPLSAPCRSVLLAAKNLKVDLNLKITNLLNGEHLQPEFLKMNPQHTIPTMDDKGFYLHESRAILQYLANSYTRNNDSFYPTDPKKRYVVDHRLAFDQGTLYQRFGDLYYSMALGLPGATTDKAKFKKLDEALGWLDDFLQKTAFVAGNNLTIADFAYAATLANIEAVGHNLNPFPRVKQYMNKLKEEVVGYAKLNQEGADQYGQWVKSAIQKASD